METKFDKNKFLKLLKEEKILQNKGKLLEDCDKMKYNQLLIYRLRSSSLSSAIRLSKRLEEEIFLLKSNEIDIQVNPKSSGFPKIISSLYSLGDICDPDVTLEMNFKQPELIFYGISYL